MHIIVLAKQIFDPEISSSVFRIDEEAKQVVPVPGMPLVISPYDEQAIEVALRIKGGADDVKITLITVGDESAKDMLKHGLSMGADSAVIVSDPTLKEPGSHTIAQLIASAIRKLDPPDLILAGRQSADLDAGVVGCGVAEILGLPAVTFAMDVALEGEKITVQRVLDDGIETVEAALPALVTISNEVGPPRKPSLRETMRAARKPVSSWSLSDIDFSAQQLAEMQARQGVERLYVPVKESACRYIEGASAADVARNLVHELLNEKLI